VSEPGFFSLHGKVAIVTGGGRGIGEAICRRFARAGARVAVLDMGLADAGKVAADIGGFAVACDVSQRDNVTRAVDEVRQKLGPIDIVVNNAGLTGRTVPLWELDEADLDRVYSVNLKGVFLVCKAVIGEMLERRSGRIVNIASIAGKEGNPTLIPYSATKAGVICLSKALAKEVAGKGDITVNSIAPAVIRTPMNEAVAPETLKYMVSKIPMGRLGTVDEVAALVHYLASSEASFTTGQCYDISGGRATY
jgi:3-oxoacyl-[acyl-carrier protein] reductase